jgi:type IV pilus assembly protein PilA
MHRRDGFTLIELLMVVSIIAIIAALAIPGLVRARGAGNEASAIGSVRTVIQAQTVFASTCGGGGHAETLNALATAPPGGTAFVGADVAAGTKSQYTLVNTGSGNVVLPAASTCNTVADSRSAYLITATPVTVGANGQRSFASDERGTIYQDSTGAVLTAPLAEGGTITVVE